MSKYFSIGSIAILYAVVLGSSLCMGLTRQLETQQSLMTV